MELLARAEAARMASLVGADPGRQKLLGQYLTPSAAARLIASFPRLETTRGQLRVLDPGAGAGSLAAALVERIHRERPGVAVHVVAVELDDALVPALRATLSECERLEGVTTELVHGDYLELSVGLKADSRLLEPFDLVIMNPPYAKLAKSEPRRTALAAACVDTPNLYAAFWAAAVASLRAEGQCVAIVPRSWANGPYFEAFRRWLMKRLTLDRLHVFESRSTVFSDTGVLQENVIVSGTVAGVPHESVTLSVSVGHEDETVAKEVPRSAVLQPSDPHSFVRFTDLSGAHLLTQGRWAPLSDAW